MYYKRWIQRKDSQNHQKIVYARCMQQCPTSAAIAYLSSSKCSGMYQRQPRLLGQIQISQPSCSLYPLYLRVILRTTHIPYQNKLKGYSGKTRRLTFTRKHKEGCKTRIRPEILEWSSKSGIILVTEAYIESFLLQDEIKFFIF